MLGSMASSLPDAAAAGTGAWNAANGGAAGRPPFLLPRPGGGSSSSGAPFFLLRAGAGSAAGAGRRLPVFLLRAGAGWQTAGAGRLLAARSLTCPNFRAPPPSGASPLGSCMAARLSGSVRRLPHAVLAGRCELPSTGTVLGWAPALRCCVGRCCCLPPGHCNVALGGGLVGWLPSSPVLAPGGCRCRNIESARCDACWGVQPAALACAKTSCQSWTTCCSFAYSK